MKDITAALHLNNTSWFRKYFLSTSIIDPWEKCSISDPPPPPPLHPGVSWQYKNWSQVKCCKNNLPSLSRVSDLDFSLLLSPGARCLGWPGFCGPGPLALGTHCPFPWQTRAKTNQPPQNTSQQRHFCRPGGSRENLREKTFNKLFLKLGQRIREICCGQIV